MSSLNLTFTALGDETRRAILGRLLTGEAPVSELAKHHDMTLTGVSNHIRVLAEAGLIEVEKRGRTRHCRIKPSALKEASDWLEDYHSFWARQLENMSHVLKDLDE